MIPRSRNGGHIIPGRACFHERSRPIPLESRGDFWQRWIVPTRRNILAVAATGLALGLLDVAFGAWTHEFRLLLKLAAATALLAAFAFAKDKRPWVIALGMAMGSALVVMEHDKAQLTVLLGALWPLAFLLVTQPQQTEPTFGSPLAAMRDAVAWLVPSFLSVLAASASVAFCTAEHRRWQTTLAKHLPEHQLAIFILLAGALLALLQVARSVWAILNYRKKLDVGVGLDDVRHEAGAGAYRSASVVVSASPRGRAVVAAHTALATLTVALCFGAMFPMLAYPRPMCGCEITGDWCPYECELRSPVKAARHRYAP